MINRFYCVSALIILLLSLDSFSEEEQVTSTSSGKGLITQFYMNSHGNFLRVKFSKDVVNPAGCEGEDFYINELTDTEGSNRFYSTVLAAYMAKKEVSFWISGCSNNRYWDKTRPRIWDIYVNE